MGVTAVLVIIAAISVVFLFLERKAVIQMGGKILSVLAPIIYGAILAFLLSPIYNAARNAAAGFLGRKKGKEAFINSVSKMVGTIASLIFLTVVIASLSKMIIPQIYMSIQGIVNTMPAYIQNIYNWLTELFANNPPLEETVLTIYQMAVEAVQSWAGESLIPNLQSLENLQNLEKIVGGVSNGVLNLFNLAKNLLIGLIVMIYLLNIKDLLTAQVKKIVYAFAPLKTANGIIDEFRYIHKVFSGFIIGKLIDSLIIGIICFILMKLFKMPFELLISVIIGVTNVIPFFGPFIGAVPSAILVFLISPKQCLYFIGLILVLQQFSLTCFPSFRTAFCGKKACQWIQTITWILKRSTRTTAPILADLQRFTGEPYFYGSGSCR